MRTLRTSATEETRKRMTAEVQELRARKLLAKHQQSVLDDIERRKKYAAYGLCIEQVIVFTHDVVFLLALKQYADELGIEVLDQHVRIAQIADISAEDCKAVETAMTKCSRWLPGHDKAAAARAPVPAPSELQADIDALANWVTAIRKRRS